MRDIWSIILAFVFSTGFAGLIIKYFSGLLASRYVERIKTDFEIEKTSKIRYLSFQFEEYSKLWSSLYDLKLEGESLWERADSDTLALFTQQLRKTKAQIEKASLFIEDRDYTKLMKILNSFASYKIGKGKLIDFRRNGFHEDGQIIGLIESNGETKKEYESLILEIRKDLKKQLKS